MFASSNTSLKHGMLSVLIPLHEEIFMVVLEMSAYLRKLIMKTLRSSPEQKHEKVNTTLQFH